MFKTNYTLIENISNEFNIDKNEINLIIKELFDKITSSIINGNKFYMDKLGVISADEDKKIFFSNEDESFDESLESIDVKSTDIKDIFLEKSIFKSIFKNIKDISKSEHVYIENFGTFYYNSNIIFDPDTYLKNKVKNNEVTEDILEELDNKILSKRMENINNDEILEEVIDEENNSIDDNIIGNIWKNKAYNSIDLNTMIENLNEKEEKTDNNESNTIIEEVIMEKDEKENNYPEMKEYSKEELLDINNFDEDYLNENTEENIKANKTEDN
ncbi:HU family DNA-binding protein, partial [Brachyspira innocens]|uniref:HU family DNA-binding protein n=1 Tax=Brachyspira innocens TaxID=13264 RepID=UPI00035DE9E2